MYDFETFKTSRMVKGIASKIGSKMMKLLRNPMTYVTALGSVAVAINLFATLNDDVRTRINQIKICAL